MRYEKLAIVSKSLKRQEKRRNKTDANLKNLKVVTSGSRGYSKGLAFIFGYDVVTTVFRNFQFFDGHADQL